MNHSTSWAYKSIEWARSQSYYYKDSRRNDYSTIKEDVDFKKEVQKSKAFIWLIFISSAHWVCWVFNYYKTMRLWFAYFHMRVIYLIW